MSCVEQIQALADGLATCLGRAVLVDDRELPQFRDISRLPGYVADGYHFAADKASFSVSGQTVLPRLPGLTERDERRYYGMVLRPNCFLSLLPDHVIVHRFQPAGPELTTVTCEWLFPPETIARYDVADTVALFHLVNAQDFAATEACQPNMKSRAYANGGVLVPLEQEVIGHWYYQWYRDSMGLPATGPNVTGLNAAGPDSTGPDSTGPDSGERGNAL
jgi:Rieske 2Fe-2S family protein